MKKYHFIGIGGIGMSGLARILLERGLCVSGSDRAPNYMTEALAKLGATIYPNHAKEHVTGDMTIVYSSDVPVHNPEYQAALELGCPILHRSDLLALLMEGYKVLAVAGTHGKTTTSGLLTTVMKETDPSFAVGGVIRQYDTNSGGGLGPYFVAEADESDRTFLKYHPYAGIITNIGRDHLNNYDGEEGLIAAFGQFASQCEHLFYGGDDERLNSLNLKGIAYGFAESCPLRTLKFRQEEWINVLDIAFEGKIYRDVEVALIGRHNALNATAVFGLALSLGVREEQIRCAFKAFLGTKRRQERKWEEREVLFLDDYAHHPTEIQTTLKGIRTAIGEKKLIAVYQPHRYTRIKECIGTFGGIFDAADEVIITDLYSAGETAIPGVTHEPILGEVNKACYVPRETLALHLSTKAGTPSVIVTLGAGDITRLSSELYSILS
jgi:UDP-N-acetylmuramate--L-alanine ligase